MTVYFNIKTSKRKKSNKFKVCKSFNMINPKPQNPFNKSLKFSNSYPFCLNL